MMVKNTGIVSFGEVLWDVVAARELPGGAPMNVAYHLTTLGHDVTLFSRIGKDARGQALLSFLEDRQLSTVYIQADPKRQTGIVSANSDKDGNMSYDIVEGVAWDYIASDPSHDDVMKDTAYFVFGSLATRCLTSRDTLFQLMEYPNRKVMDINLRKPFINKKMLEYQLSRANILKMNEEELDFVSDWYTPTRSMVDRLSFLQDRFDIETLIVTRGARGAIVRDHGQIYENSGIYVEVADTIGSGDSFLAGFLSRLIAHDSIDKALSFACGLGSYVATKQGGCPLYNTIDVQAFLDDKKLF